MSMRKTVVVYNVIHGQATSEAAMFQWLNFWSVSGE